MSTPTWVRRLRESTGAHGTLICLPHGGGTASAYRPLAEAMAPTVDVIAAQYPGRQDRIADPMVDDIATIADSVVTDLPKFSDRPIAVFGHSMGATVAFEVARRLERGGQTLAALFVSGRPGPGIDETGTLHTQPDSTLLDDMRLLGGPDSAVVDMLTAHPDLAEVVLPSVRNDYKAVETYRYSPGPDVTCPIVALLSDDDPTTDRESIDEWRNHTTGTFELHTFSGGHFYLDEHLDEIAAIVAVKLAPPLG